MVAGRQPPPLSIIAKFFILKVSFATLSSYEKINSESVVGFFKKIETIDSEFKKIHVILDRAAYYKRSLVQNFLKNENIIFHVPSPYISNLNPIDRLWKIINEYVKNNRYSENTKSFRESINNFFTEIIPRIIDVLCKKINSYFQIIINSS